jgi:hypothetical protein
MKKASILQVVSKVPDAQGVLYQNDNPANVARWLVTNEKYPVIAKAEDADFKIVGGKDVYLVDAGLINLFVERFYPEIIDSKQSLAKNKAQSSGLLESGVSFEYIWKFLGDEEANARVSFNFNESFETDRRSHRLYHLKDFHVGDLVYWRWIHYGSDRLAGDKMVRPFGRVISKSMRPDIRDRIAIQTIDDPEWIIDIQQYLEKGVSFYSTTEIHQIKPKTTEHERLLARHQAGTATAEEMERCHEIEMESHPVWWFTKAFMTGVAFIWGLYLVSHALV